MDNISSRLVNDERPNDLNNNVKVEQRKTFTCQFKVSDIMVPNKKHHSSEFDYKDFRWWVYVEWNSTDSTHLAAFLCCEGLFADWIIKADFNLKLFTQTPGTKNKCFEFKNCVFDDDGRSPFKRERDLSNCC